MSRTIQATSSEPPDNSMEPRAIGLGAGSPTQFPELEQKFKRDNAEGFASMNNWVEEHGLPLDKYRQF